MAYGSIHVETGTICKAQIKCPFGESDHVETIEEYFVMNGADPNVGKQFIKEGADPATALELSKDSSLSISTVTKAIHATPESTGEFSLDSFYGKVKPREIQPDALNGVINALAEDPATQLVAACGTGKSYMGRQIMAHMMNQEDANGISIVLTSSIKLAQDTANDLRPTKDLDNYDHSLGDYNKDYVVIEVHSESKDMLEKSTVSTEKIQAAWQKALDEGKKVVIVSTYDSSSKVQEVQKALLENGAPARADLIMNDEAHNILGQQRSTSSSTSGINTGYKSFHDEVPGAIQSNKRLYATATPVVVESTSDANSIVADASDDDGRIIAMKFQAAKMEKDQKARITIYSDDEQIVGKVSGYISQETAINSKCLSEPSYQIREASVRGDSTHQYVSPEGVYTPSAELREQREFNLTPQTYGAVTATLTAMASDPEPGKNPSHNALAYCGSIEQARAYKENMSAVAMNLSGNMDLATAQANMNASDPDMKRRARMRLLAESATVEAAYSGDDAESKANREKAFKMFKGNSITAEQAEQGWSPNKRILANVDIFSEGVSISEIDTVVISDDSKTSERAMTQAIGRSIRVLPNNPYKNTGHVIVPQVTDEQGRELNGGSVAIASYGATRVERGVAANKLRGNAPVKDEMTTFKKYDSKGVRTKDELASDIAARHVTSTADVVTAHNLERAHLKLLTADRGTTIPEDKKYKNLSVKEQYTLMASYIGEQADSKGNKDASWALSKKRIEGKTAHDMNSIRQSNKVLVSSLGAGDIGSLPETLTKDLVKANILRPKGSGGKNDPTPAEKKAFVADNVKVITQSLLDAGVEKTEPELFQIAIGGVDKNQLRKDYKAARGSNFLKKRAEESLIKAVESDPAMADKFFDYVQRGKKATTKVSTLHDGDTGLDFQMSLMGLFDNAASRTASKAVAGESMFEVNPDFVQSTGLLKVDALKNLS